MGEDAGHNCEIAMVSVVIPTHNRERTIKRAIDSVRNQSIKDIEVIVVSDGSTDTTNCIVEKISQQDKRVRLIAYGEPKGGNFARNTGAQAASYEYIAFLDDDDEWLPTKLEKQIAVFSKNEEIGLVYTGITVLYENDGNRYVSLPKYSGNLKKEILFHNCITTTSSVVIKKTVLEKAGYFDTALKALQDYDLWIRCCQFTEVGYVKECLVNYYINAKAGQITANTEKNRTAFEQIEDKYQYLYKSLTAQENKIRLCNRYCGLAKYALKNGESRSCRDYAKQAFQQRKSLKAVALFLASFIGIKVVLKMKQSLKR